MLIKLPFGLKNHWNLNISNTSITRLGPTSDSLPLPNPATEIRSTLRSPLNYPPLASATVPGDQVVVTIPPGIPSVQELAKGIYQSMQDAGVDAANLTFLVSDQVTQSLLSACQDQTSLPTCWSPATRVVLHNPQDTNSCCLLGVTQAGNPLRMNRLLSKADLILPVGMTTAPDNIQISPEPGRQSDQALLTGLFPEFSDQETLQRFYAPSSQENHVHRLRRRREIEEANRLLSSGLVVQVVPAPQNQIGKVYAGHPLDVAVSAWKTCQNNWQPTFSKQGDLAIGLLTGITTWPGIGRAIQAAETVLKSGGRIALCTNLEQPPSQSLSRLGQPDESIAYEQEIMRDREAESWTALQLARRLQEGPIYLHSKLKNKLVEKMGMTPLGSEQELARLVASTHEPVVLDDAQWLVPQVV